DTAPALMLPGSIQTISENAGDVRSLGHVSVIGVDERLAGKLGLPDSADWKSEKPQVVLSHRVAERLHVAPGDRVRIGVERFSDLPRASSLARRGNEDVIAARTLPVAGVLAPDAAGNDFNLSPNPAAPLNVFVPLAMLSGLVQNDSDVKANAFFSSGASVDEL